MSEELLERAPASRCYSPQTPPSAVSCFEFEAVIATDWFSPRQVGADGDVTQALLNGARDAQMRVGSERC